MLGGAFCDPELEAKFITQQLPAVAAFFAKALTLQAFGIAFSLARSLYGADGHLMLQLSLVRASLLTTVYFALQRSSSVCSAGRAVLLFSGSVLAVVVITLILEALDDQATSHLCAGIAPSMGKVSNADVVISRLQDSAIVTSWSAFSGRFVLIQWLLSLAGFFSSIPVRYFVPSWLLTQVMTIGALATFRPMLVAGLGSLWLSELSWLWLLSAIVSLAASARSERHDRFTFLLRARGKCWDHPQCSDQDLESLEPKAALNHFCLHDQLWASLSEVFEVLVAVDISSFEKGGGTLVMKEVSPQKLQRLASMLGEVDANAAMTTHKLSDSLCLEDYLSPSASQQWHAYMSRRLGADGDGGSLVRLELAGSGHKELEALLLPQTAAGSPALLCLRSLSEVDCCTSAAPSEECGGSTKSTASCPASEVDLVDAAAEVDVSCGEGDTMDCLPPHACVWVQGVDTPMQLSDLKPGMRILTADPLRSPPLSFEPVRKISMVADHDEDMAKSPHARRNAGAGQYGEAQHWVRVALYDGSEVMMTAQHPIYPEGNSINSGYTLGALKAEDLVPGVDSLIALSTKPVVVKSVTQVPPEESPGGRVQIELGFNTTDQGADVRSRRTLLMSMPQEEGAPPVGTCFVGVCDSAVKPASNRFDALEEDDGSASLTTRSGSWPSTGSGCGPRDAEARENNHDEVEIILGSVDERSGWRRSRLNGEWIRCEEADASRTVRLSDIMALPRNSSDGERLSYGSIAHAVKSETCKVCVFNRKNGAVCRNGWACTFCHAWHQPYVRPRRPDKRRNKSGQNPEIEDGNEEHRDEGPSPSSGSRGAGAKGGASRPSPQSMVEPWYVQPSGMNSGRALTNPAPLRDWCSSSA
jgi:hypothetical protein